MNTSNSFSIWWRSLRAYSLPMTMLPILCAFLYARAMGYTVLWSLFPVMLLCGVLLHAGTNLLNDHYDYTLGFDTDEASGASGLLQEKLVPENYMLFYGRLYLVLGCLFGLPLIRLRGLPMLLLGILAICGAYFYSHPKGYKYKGIGEPAVFLLMGPLLFTASIYAACGTCPQYSFIPACAFGCLVTAVLLINNMRDEQMDRNAGFITMPMRLGPSGSRNLYSLLLAGAEIIPLLLLFTGLLQWPVLLPLLSLPPAIRLGRMVQTARLPSMDLKTGPQQTAQVYMIYGSLMAVGLALCR